MMRPTRRPETSVYFNHMSPLNNPQESDYNMHRCKNLKLQKLNRCRLKLQMYIANRIRLEYLLKVDV